MGKRLSDLNPRTMRGPGDFGPPDEPDEIEGTEEEVLAMLRAPARRVEHYIADEHGDWDHAITPDADGMVSDALLRQIARSEGATVIVRCAPIAVVGMREGWAAPVVVRLAETPLDVAAERLTTHYEKCCDALDDERAEVRQLRGEVVRLRAAALRAIAQAWRSGYDERQTGLLLREAYRPTCRLSEPEAVEYLEGEVCDG